MRHLDERVSELVDNRLEYDERDQALAHLAVCGQCRSAVEYERTAKAALRSLSDVEPSDRLTSALFSLAEPGGPMPPERSALAKSAPVAGWREQVTPTPAKSSSRLPNLAARRVKLVAAGMVSASGVVALLAAVGAPPDGSGTEAQFPDTASIVPTAEAFLIDHAQTTGGLPFTEPASYLAPMLPVVEEAR